MTRLQVSHQRAPSRRTKTKARTASERLASGRGSLIVQRSDGPQSQTAGPGDGRSRRRRRRRGDNDDDDNVRVRGGEDGGGGGGGGDGARSGEGDGQREDAATNRGDVCAVIALCDDVGGAVGAAIVGVEVGIGVSVTRGCNATTKSSSLVTGRRPSSPSAASGVGRCRTTKSSHHYATLSHGEKVEVESMAGPRGRSAERAKGRDARGRPAGGAAAAAAAATSATSAAAATTATATTAAAATAAAAAAAATSYAASDCGCNGEATA